MSRRTTIWTILAFVGAVSIIAVSYLHYERSAIDTAQEPYHGTLSQRSTGASVSFTNAMELLEFSWDDVDEFMRNPELRSLNAEQIPMLEAGAASVPGRYVLAFFSMLHERPQRALDVFDSIPVGEIPSRFLYAPYRLERTVRPFDSNRYLAPLRDAIAQNTIAPLIQARVLSIEGDPQAALSAYLRTDPVKWVQFDAECLRSVSQHAGLQRDIRMLIAGALRSGRVRRSVEKELREIALPDDNVKRVTAFKKHLKRVLQDGNAAGDIAMASAKRMLEARQQFLQRDYAGLVARYRDSNVTAVTTETTLLVFLSATALQNASEIERWGQEIKRRFPDRKVERWLGQWMTAHN
jgi:hypothetical protein